MPYASCKLDHNQRNVIFLMSISLKSAKGVNDSLLNFFCGFGGVFATSVLTICGGQVGSGKKVMKSYSHGDGLFGFLV